MKNTLKFVTVALFATVLGTSAFAQHAGHEPKMDMPAMQKMMKEMMPKDGDAPSTKDLKQAHMKMMMAAPTQFSGNVEVDFVRQMIPHHQGAIDMAKVQLAHGKDPHIRAMAEKIIKDQEKEIAEMEDWLKKSAK
jgi:uncharacterized protein (DUF305 family)